MLYVSSDLNNISRALEFELLNKTQWHHYFKLEAVSITPILFASNNFAYAWKIRFEVLEVFERCISDLFPR